MNPLSVDWVGRNHFWSCRAPSATQPCIAIKEALGYLFSSKDCKFGVQMIRCFIWPRLTISCWSWAFLMETMSCTSRQKPKNIQYRSQNKYHFSNEKKITTSRKRKFRPFKFEVPTTVLDIFLLFTSKLSKVSNLQNVIKCKLRKKKTNRSPLY